MVAPTSISVMSPSPSAGPGRSRTPAKCAGPARHPSIEVTAGPVASPDGGPGARRPLGVAGGRPAAAHAGRGSPRPLPGPRAHARAPPIGLSVEVPLERGGCGHGGRGRAPDASAQPHPGAAFRRGRERPPRGGDRVCGIQLPGVVGGLPEAEAFAVAWCARTGNTARRVMGQGIYSLTEVLPVPAVAGTPRTARPDDLNLVAGWIQAFQDEVVPDALRSDPEERRRRLGSILGSDEEGICLWEAEDQVVSLSGFGGPTPNGIRIGPVYTPPALRGRGYATTLVADLSRRQ